MKKIIDRKAYNTETATVLAALKRRGSRYVETNGVRYIQFSRDGHEGAGTSTLYQTRGGAYFLAREEKEGFEMRPDPMGPVVRGRRAVIDKPGLYPFSREQALAWAENNLETEEIERIFGEIPEAGTTGGSVLLRLPESLKSRVEHAASAAGQSVGTFAMRCLERCLEARGPR